MTLLTLCEPPNSASVAASARPAGGTAMTLHSQRERLTRVLRVCRILGTGHGYYRHATPRRSEGFMPEKLTKSVLFGLKFISN